MFERVIFNSDVSIFLSADSSHFAKWDQPADQKMLTLELKTTLSNIAYLRTLIRDVDRALENAKAA